MASNIVPFGKYKGQPFEVMLGDQSYMAWLSEQQWVKDKYPVIQTLIINNFGEPNDTPEHNEMQANFFDDKYLKSFLIGAVVRPTMPSLISTAKETIGRVVREKDELEKNLEKADETVEGSDVDVLWYVSKTFALLHKTVSVDEARESLHMYDDAVKELTELLGKFMKGAVPANRFLNFEATSEVGGWDICLTNPSCQEWDSNWDMTDDGAAFRQAGLKRMMLVELKPEMGDDFPATLRQMKMNRKRFVNEKTRTLMKWWGAKNDREYYFERKVQDRTRYFLVYKSFHSATVSEENMRKQFSADGFAAIREDEFWPLKPWNATNNAM